MSEQKSRPPLEVVIEDCRSLMIPGNVRPICEHGKRWRESDMDVLLPELSIGMCLEEECAAIEHRPHVGESVTLHVPRSIRAGRELQDRIQKAVGDEAWDVTMEIVKDAVKAWTWTGISGFELPLPSEDPDCIEREIEPDELIWLQRAVLSKGDPRTRMLAKGRAEDPTSGDSLDG